MFLSPTLDLHAYLLLISFYKKVMWCILLDSHSLLLQCSFIWHLLQLVDWGKEYPRTGWTWYWWKTLLLWNKGYNSALSESHFCKKPRWRICFEWMVLDSLQKNWSGASLCHSTAGISFCFMLSYYILAILISWIIFQKSLEGVKVLKTMPLA